MAHARVDKVTNAVLGVGRALTQSRGRCFAFSLVATTIVFVAASMAWIYTDANDDFALALSLSGNWGAGDGRVLFINVLLGNAVFFLNTHLPVVDWFTAYEMVLSYLALLTIVYFSLSRSSLPTAGLCLAGLLILVVPGVTFLSNFTYVSAVGAAAGGMVLVVSLRESHRNPTLVVVGICFMVAAALLRLEAFFLSLPFFLLVAAVVAVRQGGEGARLWARMALLWPFLAVFCLVGLAMFADSVAWQEEPWKSWAEYNDARSTLGDFPDKDYEDIADELANLGVSENDYDMMHRWMTEDSSFFTTELLTQVGEVAKIDLLTPERVLSSAKSYFTTDLVELRIDAILALALLVLVFAMRGIDRRMAVAFLALALAMSLAFSIVGRLPMRVHFPIWMLAFTAMASYYAKPGQSGVGNAASDVEPAQVQGSPVLAVSHTLLIAVTVALYVFIVAFSLLNFSPGRVEATLFSRNYVPDTAIATYLRDHDDTTFVLSQGSEKAVRSSYYLRGFPSHESLYHVADLGGWTTRSPYVQAKLEAIGLDNVMKSLVDDDHVRLIWHRKSGPGIILNYLQEHYYPNCTYTLVDTIDCSDVKVGTLYVFDFEKN